MSYLRGEEVELETHPTPVKPDHPIESPFLNSFTRSSGLASLLKRAGRRTRSFKAAEGPEEERRRMLVGRTMMGG